MKYYAKIENAEAKTVSIGTGTNHAFYESIGMELMDVEQGYDGSWYVAGYAPKQPISKLRTSALSRIDSATSAAILSGFEYEVEGEALHFSYDEHDQQNFADTANACLLTLSGVDGLPQSVVWNGWKNHNAESKGDLVRLTLNAQTFLTLYSGGALVHKATQMEIGGQRKAAIEAAESVEDIEALMEGWGV